MAAGRHFGFASTGSSTIQSANPGNRILEPKNEVDRMTHCRDMAIQNFSTWPLETWSRVPDHTHFGDCPKIFSSGC